MVKGILEVQLLDAKGLKDTDIGKIDPYVLIQYRSQERKSSIARDQGMNPQWNETFKFVVNSQAVIDSNHHHKLILQIMDHDTLSKDDYLGEATIEVGDLIALGIEKGREELRPTKYSVVLSDRSYSGEIRVALTFTTKMEEMNEQEFGGYKHSSFFS